MKNVCGGLYSNVLRDNERHEFMEQFLIRKPKLNKWQQVKRKEARGAKEGRPRETRMVTESEGR